MLLSGECFRIGVRQLSAAICCGEWDMVWNGTGIICDGSLELCNSSWWINLFYECCDLYRTGADFQCPNMCDERPEIWSIKTDVRDSKDCIDKSNY